MARTLETYLQPPGPLDLRSRLTSSHEEVVLTAIKPLPEAVPRLFADALNQLRNVMEHALGAEVSYRLSRSLTPDEARAVEVPATNSEGAFDAWTRHKHRKSHGLFARGSELGERLARLQPWNRADSDMHPLRRLVAHTNAAKHQAPTVTTVRVGKVVHDSVPREAPTDAHDLGDIGSVIAAVPRGSVEGISVWPQVAVRRPHTGELRTLMWEVRELEDWVRCIALPILIAGRTDLPKLRPDLDVREGFETADHAWSRAGSESAAARASERLQAAALRMDIADMMAADDGESSYDLYAQWLATIDDAQVVAMFAPLGEAARARDFETIMRITGGWRDAAGRLG